ncbi:MAG TPA: DNA polymerase/3'-5' exonuclease PolX, partial [Candidatus Polarisedimenticolaceae bacterium]
AVHALAGRPAMSDKAAVADALEEIGLLLELLGENPFKTRAYANAARVLRGLDRDLDTLVRAKQLGEIKGFGPALVEKIGVLVTTGRLPYLEDLRRQVPAGMLDWLKIPGLGPKKARAIHLNLGIATLAQLETAAKEGKLRDLEGFGAASEKKILDGIARVRDHASRFLQPLIRAEADRLLALVRAIPGVERAEVAGSARRRGETSKDIDVVCTAKDPAKVLDAFATAPGVAAVIGKGDTKCSVALESGPNADLRVVAAKAYPFALLYFTGSKAHNIALRARAGKLGLKLNEYGLVAEDGRETAAGDETAIYRALGLPWIEPELREDAGEIEAAEAGTLPRLIERSDLKGILHVHSTWSDGTASIREMAEAARAMGMAYLGLCDHSRAAAYAGGLSIERVREQHAEIDRINADYAGAFRVLKGTEVDILADGSLDYPDEVLSSFDLVVASVHSRFNLPVDEQTARIVRAIDGGFVDIVGHPTGRLLLTRDGYPLHLNRVLDAAAAAGVAVEINAHPQRLDLDPPALRYGIARGMKTAIDPDSHDTAGLSDVDYGVGVARKGWCTAEDVLNAWPLDRLLAWLRDRRARARA